MVKRALLIVTAFATLLGGLVLPAAAAVTRSSIRIVGVQAFAPRALVFDQGPRSHPTPMPHDMVILSGSVTGSTERVVVLQRLVAGSWREVSRVVMTGWSSSWRAETGAGAAGRHLYRALALRTRTAGAATSPTFVLAVPKPTVSVTAAATVETGRLVSFTGRAVPARRGRPVQLWELSGPRWVAVADTTQSATGAFTMRLLAAPLGRHTYRAVTFAHNGRFDVRSPSRDVTTVGASTAGPRSAYLADVAPVTVIDTAPRRVQTVTVAGHPYVKSIKTLDRRLTWQLGDGFQSLTTALVMQTPETSNPTYNRNGPRLVEVRVDAVLRLRRFIRPGQVVPLTLDLGGRHTLTIATYASGDAAGTGGALTLLTPVVTTVPRPERGLDTTVWLTERRPVAQSGPATSIVVLGSLSTTLYGGSLVMVSQPSRTTLVGTVDYDLGGAATTLTGVPRVTGADFSAPTGRIRVYGDGALLATLECTLGDGVATVDVTGVHRLRIELVADPAPDTAFFPWGVGLADPRLT